MEQKELEVYSETSNFGIIRMPGRNFPACAIQGDSLCGLYRLAFSVLEKLKAMQAEQELLDDASDLLERLNDRLKHYEAVLAENGFDLPYSKRKVP